MFTGPGSYLVWRVVITEDGDRPYFVAGDRSRPRLSWF